MVKRYVSKILLILFTISEKTCFMAQGADSSPVQ